MASRRTLAPALAILILSSVACSKTQDTAPERKVFGEPPVIKSATMTFQNKAVSCDWGTAFDCSFKSDPCAFDPDDGVGPDGIRFTRDDCGFGFEESDPGNVVQVTPGPSLFISGTYQELSFRAEVTDPNTTPARSDILLVGASFVVPSASSPQEDTLVMLDDGGSNSFLYVQTAGLGIFENCSVASDGTCTCSQAEYVLNSNDTAPGDGKFERKFALFNLPDQNVRGFLQDCIAKQYHQAPKTAAPDLTFDFRIDAVDRSGNITTWPNRPQVTTTRDTYTCSGDQCLCCILRSNIGDCGGCEGMVGPKTPEGACKNAALGRLKSFDPDGTCPIPP
jgi:hypothetical protein